MKAKTLLPLLFLAHLGRAAIVVPGANGTDGALNITANTEIDLSQAVTGVWDQDNTANLGKGVYDPAKWAVVFKYTDVTIAGGATVTFKNHPSRAPVVWLVSGNVTIDGAIALVGSNWRDDLRLAEPGPGGFRGGSDAMPTVAVGSGFGIGGGEIYMQSGGGSYGSLGRGSSGGNYGNPSCIPLIGGSGSGGAQGGSNGEYIEQGGAAGGGAVLIASVSSISIGTAGAIRANGGDGYSTFWGNGAGGGSGGAIRLLCETLTGAGDIQAIGGSPGGGNGRIRIERVINSNSSIPLPAPSVVDLAPGSTALLWPPSASPEVRIVSVGEDTGPVAAPADPRAAFGTFGADMAIGLTTNTIIRAATLNVETNSIVRLRITPRDTFNAIVTNMTYTGDSPDVSGWDEWKVSAPVNPGYSAIQIQVIRP